MNKTILALSAAALALTGTTAIAQHRGAHNPDTDGNGSVTLTEMQAASAERFARMDANGDGVINAADRQARGAQMFARADAAMPAPPPPPPPSPVQPGEMQMTANVTIQYELAPR